MTNSNSENSSIQSNAADSQRILGASDSVAEKVSTILADIQQTTVSVSVLAKDVAQQHALVVTTAKEIDVVRNSALASQSRIEDFQTVVATKSEHIEAAREHADNVRAAMDRALAEAKQETAQIVAQKNSAQAFATEIEATSNSAQKSRDQIDAILSVVDEQRSSAAKSATVLKGLADTAEQADARVVEYEAQLKDLIGQSKKQLETIVGLLPGATSAGLASSFEKRQLTFQQPVARWQNIFIGAIAMLAVLACTGVLQAFFADHVLTYDELVRSWLIRLPFAGALVWLALYASRESSLARRLEEDYGYKAAIASAFEGFQNQMKGIVNEGDGETPLSRLCVDTLATLASPPGRIYEKHALTVTPGSELGEAVKTVTGIGTTTTAK